MDEMDAKIRMDSWTKEEDDLLVRTILDYVSSGKTQSSAFQEVAEKIRRTSAACGFRWNNLLRNGHEEAFQRAKREGQIRRGLSDEMEDMVLQQASSQEITPENNILDNKLYEKNKLDHLHEAWVMVKRFVEEKMEDSHEEWMMEMEALRDENQSLKEKMEKIKEDNQMLLRILTQAQEITKKTM